MQAAKQTPYRERSRRRLGICAASAMIMVAGYVGVLGTASPKRLDPATGVVSGSYPAWKILTVALIALLLAALVGLFREPVAGALSISVTLVLSFSIESSFDAHNDGLWPIGSLMLGIVSLLGTMTCAQLVYYARYKR